MENNLRLQLIITFGGYQARSREHLIQLVQLDFAFGIEIDRRLVLAMGRLSRWANLLLLLNGVGESALLLLFWCRLLFHL
jgi:hypothetical protein